VTARTALATVVAVARRPWLWGTAVRQLFRLAPNGWWRRPPFLPLPDRRYLAFRLATQYGSPDHAPEPGDVVEYLLWCRDWHTTGRRQRRAG
jgi:hypothetical protein